jgi:hypothetical protein
VTTARKRLRRRSRPGRPRKEGATRHPSGKIVHKAPEPNERVTELRKAMLPGGDITKAENWPDLCLARGWLTEERHRAFSAYMELYSRAGVDLPRIRTFSAERVRGFDGQNGDVRAQDRLRAIWDALPSRRAQILFDATQHWPAFVMWMLTRGHVPSPFSLYRDNLFSALDTVTAILERPTTARRCA